MERPTLLRIIGSRSSDTAKPALCVCAMILLKLRNKAMNLVQAIVSVVLKAGQANIQVNIVSLLYIFSVFNRLCLSHKSTLRFLDVGYEEDWENLSWAELLTTMIHIQQW